MCVWYWYTTIFVLCPMLSPANVAQGAVTGNRIQYVVAIRLPSSLVLAAPVCQRFVQMMLRVVRTDPLGRLPICWPTRRDHNSPRRGMAVLGLYCTTGLLWPCNCKGLNAPGRLHLHNAVASFVGVLSLPLAASPTHCTFQGA